MLVDAEKIVIAARSVIDGVAPIPRHWRQVSGRSAPPPPDARTPAPKKAQAAAPSQSALAEGEPIAMPFGDLTVSEGTLLNWLKAEGDRVERGDIVAEIETDKAVVEIEAPIAGVLGPIERKKGETVPMGGRIGSVRP